MSNAYPLALAAGALACLLWISFSVPQTRMSTPGDNQRGLDAAVWALLFGISGARLGFVILHLDYFMDNPQEITWFWDGGLGWVGGVLGALLGVLIFSAMHKHRYWPLLDTLAVGAPLMGFAGWFGCLLDHCAYGKIANVGILTPSSADMFGIQASRWPVQGVGAIIHILLFLLFLTLRRQDLEEGILSMISVGSISTTNLILYFLRGDSSRLINGIRVDAMATAVLLILSILGLSLISKKSFFQQGRNET